MLPPRNQPLGGKITGAGGAQLTPQQVAEQQKIARALMMEGSQSTPVGHWTAMLNRGLQGWLGGRDMFKAREGERTGREVALAKLAGRGGQNPVAQALAAGQAAAPGGGAAYTPPAEAAQIRAGLLERGLPEHIADGFLMNFQDESGLNPGINELKPLVPGSRGGFGLYQLTGPRRTAYEQFASQRGVDASDVGAQLDWLMHELQGPESRAASAIFNTSTPGEAGAAIVNEFLRPAAEHRNSRANRYLGGAAPSGSGSYAGPGAGNVSEIAALLADPWVAEVAGPQLQAEMQQQMQMQNAAYQQQLQQQDPMRQLEMQRAQLELDQLRNPGRPKPIEVGGVLLDAETFQPIFDSRSAPGAQSAAGKIQSDLAAGLITPEQAELAFSKLGNSVNVNMGGGPELGKLSTDYGYVLGADGLPVIDPDTGLPKAAPVPGSPAALALAKESESKGKRDENSANTANIVLQDIKKAIGQTSGWTAGAGGRILGNIPGTGATDLRASMDTIKANIGFDRLQQMRESSPTGGALGGIAVQELAMLQAVLGSLDQDQSPDQLRANLERLEKIYKPIAEKAAAYPNAAEFGFGATSTESSTGSDSKPVQRRRYNPQTRSFE